MPVVLRDEFLFLAHPRTASNAVTELLIDIGGMHCNPHHAEIDHPNVRKIHRGEPVVVFVRDPRDTIITWWLKFGARQPLHEFIATYDQQHFVRHGLMFYHVPHADHVLRYEDGVEEGLRSVGVTETVPFRNVTVSKNPVAHYHDERTLAAMDARFGAEMRALGYDRPLTSRS